MGVALGGAKMVTAASNFASGYASQKASQNLVNSALVGGESLEQDLNNKQTSACLQAGKGIQF